jgi:hypothetical protein
MAELKKKKRDEIRKWLLGEYKEKSPLTTATDASLELGKKI